MIGSMENRNLVIVYHYFAHYRLGILEELAKDYNLTLVGSRKSRNGIKLIDDSLFDFIDVRNFWLFNFLFQRGVSSALKKLKPDVVIFLGDWKMISTWVFLLLNKEFRKKSFWWGHGIGKCKERIEPWRKLFYSLFQGGLVYSRKSLEICTKAKLSNVFYISNSLKEHKTEKHDVKKVQNFVFVGRLIKNRGIPELIQTFREMPNLNLFIIGEGDIQESWKQFQNITFMGPLYGKDLTTAIMRMDVMIFPGNVGLSLIDAFAHGIPVIVKDFGNCSKPEFEAFKEGFNGLSFTEGNLETSIRKFQQKEIDELELMSKNAFETYKSSYSPKIQLELIQNAIK